MAPIVLGKPAWLDGSREPPRLPAMSRSSLAALGLVVASAVAAVAGPHDPYLPKPPPGIHFPAHLVPADNPITPAKVALGRDLFFDARLSRDLSVSCASCHKPRFGWGDPRSTSVGIGGKSGTRNSPSVVNRALGGPQFWDGRAASLEEQALGPIENPIEMGFTVEEAVDRLNQDLDIRAAFEAIFRGPATGDRLAKVLATFQRTLLAGGAPIDTGAELSPGARRGMRVGMTAKDPDLGRYAVTGREGDQGAFKTPTLRNVANTAPYMHDGSLESLEEVVEFYDRGGEPNSWLSPRMFPLRLSSQEKADLVTFLDEGLTGPNPSPAAEG